MKKVELLFFGQLVDITQQSKMYVNNPGSIASLQEALLLQYPALGQTKFKIALNNKMVASDQLIPENATIAFLPPFSGG